jgi:hypothetical protein
MNEKSHNNLLKSLLLVSRIRFSEIDEISKFGKTDKERNRKISLIEKRYNKKDDDVIKNIFSDSENPEDSLNPLDGEVDPELLNDFFMSNADYEKLADMIGEAMDEIEKQDLNAKNMSSGDFKIFNEEPSFQDLVDWFKLLLLANNGELQLTLTPGHELVMIFREYVNPNGIKDNETDGTPEPKQRKKRSKRGKKGPSPEQDDQ